MKMFKDNITADKISEVGTLVYDKFDEGIRFIILRGPVSFCAYVGIPKDHPLAGFSYNSISLVPAHGGLTYGGEGVKNSPEGYYWYGWDYAHAGDRCTFEFGNEFSSEKNWTIKEIIDDSWETINSFKQLLKLVELIKNK